MEVDRSSLDSSRIGLISGVTTRTGQGRLGKLLGLPEPVQTECLDRERCLWPANILLCATVFLEDAVHYRSIAHKVTRQYLSVYRWFQSPLIQKLHWLALLVNLALAFFESPSSFSVTSDVRYNPQRIVFPRYALLIVEGLTLLWFLVYICTKISCLGMKHIQRRFWILLCLMVTVYSVGEWLTLSLFVDTAYRGFRLRRLLRPIFVIESSQLLRKAFQAVHKQTHTLIACISLAFMHILFFAVMAMFLFPKSDIRPDSHNSTYFANLHDSVFELLVLYSTANNPDIMMPAYSDRRLNALFFIVFVIIGIYYLHNIITAVVYRAFRGYFLNSIINLQLRRRIAVRAAFEILKKRMASNGSIETKETVPISVIETVLASVSMKKWHRHHLIQSCNDLKLHSETITAEQFCILMRLLDLNPRLVPEMDVRILNESAWDRLKAVGRSTAFDLVGTALAIVSVLLVTLEVSHRHARMSYTDAITYLLPVTLLNLSCVIYFALEIVIKAWACGWRNFFRSSMTHIFEATVAFSSLILQLLFMITHGSLVVSLAHVESEELPQSVLTLWAASKMCNMLFIYRLVRFLPASKNIRIIVGTVFDEVRNGGAFFGVLLSCYYTYSILGMELFGGAIEQLYRQSNLSNQTICGSYQQLEYWSNGFDDFYSSVVTLYHIMVVNQWFVFVNGFREATNSRWSELYFIIWYLFVANIGLNICVALSGDIHDAKKKRAEQHEELIVSNMYDIYRPYVKEPSAEQILERLHQHPYINFQLLTSTNSVRA